MIPLLKGIPHVPCNPGLSGLAEVIPNTVYSENGMELTLVRPWAAGDEVLRAMMKPMPLLVFVQGSSWTTPNRAFELPMLSRLAEEGWTVASVSHRDINQGFRFPAYLRDVKCAIRFMRAHRKEYAIDSERVAIWGTSSGGNAALLAGLTGDDASLKSEEYAEESDTVQAVVSCFGPTDLPALFPDIRNPRIHAMLKNAFGENDRLWLEEMRKWSPVARVTSGSGYPPFMLLHGTADPVVPVSQMEMMYTRLKEAGASVEALYVDGARHEGSFWTRESREMIFRFLRRNLSR